MSQINLLYDLLDDGLPHRTDEIMKVVYGADHLGLARVSARIFDLKKRMNVQIKSWADPEHPSLTYYQLIRFNFNGQPINALVQNTNQTA